MTDPACRKRRVRIDLEGRPVRFTYRLCQARPARPSGDPGKKQILVYLPSHGQGVGLRFNLQRELLGQDFDHFLILDIDPQPCGDFDKAQVFADAAAACLPDVALDECSFTLIGWSHGGLQALMTAREHPGRVRKVIAIAPSGLVQYRSAPALLGRFLSECVRVVVRRLRQGKPGEVGQMIRFGLVIIANLFVDLLRTLSVGRLTTDLTWAGKKVVGPSYDYPGEVTILLAEDDSIFSPLAILGGYKTPEETPVECIARYRRQCFRSAAQFELQILPGDHASPETDAGRFVQAAFR